MKKVMRVTSDLHEALIRDCLYNTLEKSGASVEYVKGMLLGMLSILVAGEWTFEEASMFLKERLPSGYREDCFPEAWRKYFV